MKMINENNVPLGDERALEARATPLTPAMQQEMSIEQVEARVNKVRQLQARLMKEDIHYGNVPGTDRPTLFKPGAELICLTFMFDPQYEHDIKQDGQHREIVSRCVLYHIPTGNRIASGEGSCSTYESKYAYRKAGAECPKCGKELRRSKDRPSYYCWTKMGGCGNTFPLNDSRIKVSGRIPNADLADQYNTVLKMANKRSLTAAVLNATAASEIYTQDMEDMVEHDEKPEPKVEVKPDNRVKVAKVEPQKPKAAAPASPTPPVEPKPATGLADGNIVLLAKLMDTQHIIKQVADPKKRDYLAGVEWLMEYFSDQEFIVNQEKNSWLNFVDIARKHVNAGNFAEVKAAVQAHEVVEPEVEKSEEDLPY